MKWNKFLWYCALMVATVYGIWWLIDGPGLSTIMDQAPSVDIDR